MASRFEECHLSRRKLRQLIGQLAHDRHCDIRPGLVLPDVDRAAADMLAPHPHHIAAPLRRVQQKLKSKAGCGAAWILRPEGRNVILASGS